MDLRETFANDEQLYEFLSELFNNKQKVSLIIDNNGLTRLEGEITSLVKQEIRKKSLLTINKEKPVKLEQVVAVNGIFRSDYSEC